MGLGFSVPRVIDAQATFPPRPTCFFCHFFARAKKWQTKNEAIIGILVKAENTQTPNHLFIHRTQRIATDKQKTDFKIFFFLPLLPLPSLSACHGTELLPPSPWHTAAPPSRISSFESLEPRNLMSAITTIPMGDTSAEVRDLLHPSADVSPKPNGRRGEGEGSVAEMQPREVYNAAQKQAFWGGHPGRKGPDDQ